MLLAVRVMSGSQTTSRLTERHGTEGFSHVLEVVAVGNPPRHVALREIMGSADATVLLVDDDADVREAVGRLLRSAGWNTQVFACAQDFLDWPPFAGIGCVVLDVSMPGMTGPELHNWMRENDVTLPVIFLSGQCDVPTSVQAMKRGALDVLQKPADADLLLHAISDAVERHRQDCFRHSADDEIACRLATLSAREREVMDHVIVGRLNKQIAADLGIAEKTVKVHRGRAMAKMRVRSVAELVHLCDQLGIEK
jgi:FixJ family two-component response regulator